MATIEQPTRPINQEKAIELNLDEGDRVRELIEQRDKKMRAFRERQAERHRAWELRGAFNRGYASGRRHGSVAAFIAGSVISGAIFFLIGLWR